MISEGPDWLFVSVETQLSQSQVTTKTTLIGKYPGRNLSLALILREPLSVGNVSRSTHYVKILATGLLTASQSDHIIYSLI